MREAPEVSGSDPDGWSVREGQKIRDGSEVGTTLGSQAGQAVGGIRRHEMECGPRGGHLNRARRATVTETGARAVVAVTVPVFMGARVIGGGLGRVDPVVRRHARTRVAARGRGAMVLAIVKPERLRRGAAQEGDGNGEGDETVGEDHAL